MAAGPHTHKYPVAAVDSTQSAYNGPAPPPYSPSYAPHPVHASAPYLDQPYQPAAYPSAYSYPPQAGAPYNPYPGQVGYVGYVAAPPTDAQQQLQPTAPQQQQQQPTVNINARRTVPVIAQSTPTVSYAGHIVLACFVFWFCGVLFGAIAFFLALGAKCTRQEVGNRAKRLGLASIALSFTGIIFGVIGFTLISVARTIR